MFVEYYFLVYTNSLHFTTVPKIIKISKTRISTKVVYLYHVLVVTWLVPSKTATILVSFVYTM